MTLATEFYNVFIAGFGSPLIAFVVLLLIFAVIFFITKQSISSSALLGIVLLDSLDRLSNHDQLIFLINLGVKVLVLGGIGYVIASSTFRK